MDYSEYAFSFYLRRAGTTTNDHIKFLGSHFFSVTCKKNDSHAIDSSNNQNLNLERPITSKIVEGTMNVI